jgi:uncharacterized RDD family membrane protein YckC
MLYLFALLAFTGAFGELFGAAPASGVEPAFLTFLLIAFGALSLAWLFGLVVPEWMWGATAGKGIMGLRVRSADDRRPALWQVVVRNLPWLPIYLFTPVFPPTALIWFALVAGVFVSTAASRNGRGFHDSLAGGTTVVRRLTYAPVAYHGAGPAVTSGLATGSIVPTSPGAPRRKLRNWGLIAGVAALALMSLTYVSMFTGFTTYDVESGPRVIDPQERQRALDGLLRSADQIDRDAARFKGDPDEFTRLRRACDRAGDRLDAYPADIGSSTWNRARDLSTAATFECRGQPRVFADRIRAFVSSERLGIRSEGALLRADPDARGVGQGPGGLGLGGKCLEGVVGTEGEWDAQTRHRDPAVLRGMPAPDGEVQAVRQLKGFKSLSLAPGASRVVKIRLDSRAFSYWSEATDAWQVAPGCYRLDIGTSSRNAVLSSQRAMAGGRC